MGRVHALVRPWRLLYLRVLRQRGMPEQVAGGMAIGVFVGMFIPPGIQIVIAFGLAILFKCNRVLAVLAVFVTNPFTIVPIWGMQLGLGSMITGIPLADLGVRIPTNPQEFWLLITDISGKFRALSVFFVGALLSSVVAATGSYYATLLMVRQHRARKKIKEARKLGLVPAEEESKK